MLVTIFGCCRPYITFVSVFGCHPEDPGDRNGPTLSQETKSCRQHLMLPTCWPTFIYYIISVENCDRYAGDKAWNFYENDEIKGQFKEEDMRLGVVWRELCLENHQVGIFIFPTIAIFPGSS